MPRLPTLPQGVTTVDWGLEQVRVQNPLIRAFLTCFSELDGVVETDYHLMHCSRDRLDDIRARLDGLGRTIRTHLPPALETRSTVPELEEARSAARQALDVLEEDLFPRLEPLPSAASAQQLVEHRKLLCVATATLQTFLHSAFGEVMAADPRSQHSADYYLSRRLPREIQEAKWLHENVAGLATYLQSIEADRQRLLASSWRRLDRTGELPDPDTAREILAFLVGVYNALPAQLKEIVCLRGIRFEEMTELNRRCVELPTKCLSLFEVQGLCLEILAALETSGEEGVKVTCRGAVIRRLGRLLADVDASLRELARFVEDWQRDINSRRALVFLSEWEEEAVASGPEPEETAGS